jgi:hypothetical protein
MTDATDNPGHTVRITVKLRPDEYDAMVRHVRDIGSTMSAFLRESAAKAIRDKHRSAAHSRQSRSWTAPARTNVT